MLKFKNIVKYILFMEFKIPQRKLTYTILSFILIISFFTRLTGLVTFQKTINGEEGGMGVYLLQKKGIIQKYKTPPSNRGYFHGFAKFYYLPLLIFFNPTIALIKFTNLIISLIFVFLLAITLKIIYDDFYEKKKKTWESFVLLLLNWLYIAIPPLLLVIWSLKVRPDFLDTLVLGQLLFILSIKIVKKDFPLTLAFLISFLSTLGFTAQPLIIYYIIPSVIYIFLNFIPKLQLKKFIKLIILGFFGSVLGILPLIIYRKRNALLLIKFLNSKIIEGPYDSPLKRIFGFLKEAYPMFINLRTESSHTNNLIHTPYDKIVYILISVLILIPIFYSILDLPKKRFNKSINLFIIGIISFFTIIYMSNFASFLSEPRRVLPFYSFYFPLIFYALLLLYNSIKHNKFLKYIPFVVVILLILTDTLILAKTAYEFNPNKLSKIYRDRKLAVNNLLKNHIYYIYTVSWIGNPITTESQGKILWSHFPLSNLSSPLGFNFEKRLKNAGIVLFKNEPKDQLLITTLKNMKIPNKIIDQDLILFYNLENYFRNYNELLHIINNAIKYPSTCPLNGCFSLYTKRLIKFSKIGKLQQSMLCNSNQKGYLFYGPYVWLKKGNYKITLYGKFSNVKGAILDVVSNKGNDVYKRITLDHSQVDNDKYIINFSLNHDVDDLEIRLYTLPTNDICIKKYEVIIN